MLEAYGLSDIGKVRTENQDAFRIIPELGLYLLADGMGGARGGERASALAVESAAENLASATTRDAAALVRAVEVANSRVLAEASRDPHLEGMGTTLVAVLDTGDNNLAVASVGDSRAYLLSDVSDGTLRQVTEDQTWIHEVGAPLGLDANQLRNHPMRHVLTMAIGVSRDVRIRYYAVPFETGDLLLLSSDGLHGVVDDAQIEAILKADNSLAARCRSLVDAAHDAGSPDNVTVLLLRP